MQEGIGCSALNANCEYIIVTSINEDIGRIYYETYYADGTRYRSCSGCIKPSNLIPMSSNSMANLISLTKEQKASLKPDDQALIELGLIDDKLVRTAAGQAYLIDQLWSENKAALAKKAATEIAEIKAIEAKEKAAAK